MDKNGTMGIDFEEFLVALSANKLADKSKLKRLQEMSAHPFFSVDTLITEERRKKLFKSIVKQSQLRQAEIDALYRKYEKPKLSRKERDGWVRELELLEGKQSRSISAAASRVSAASTPRTRCPNWSPHSAKRAMRRVPRQARRPCISTLPAGAVRVPERPARAAAAAAAETSCQHRTLPPRPRLRVSRLAFCSPATGWTHGGAPP